MNEDAISDDAWPVEMGAGTSEQTRKTREIGMMTNPHSMLHGHKCPHDQVEGWKRISLAGRVASRSFGDLQRLGMRWEWETQNENEGDRMDVDEVLNKGKLEGVYLPTASPLETLPIELLRKFVLSTIM